MPALEVELGLQLFLSPWLYGLGKSCRRLKAALPAHPLRLSLLKLDNLILTKYHGLKTVFDSAEFTNLDSLRQSLFAPDCLPMKAH